MKQEAFELGLNVNGSILNTLDLAWLEISSVLQVSKNIVITLIKTNIIITIQIVQNYCSIILHHYCHK